MSKESTCISLGQLFWAQAGNLSTRRTQLLLCYAKKWVIFKML